MNWRQSTWLAVWAVSQQAVMAQGVATAVVPTAASGTQVSMDAAGRAHVIPAGSKDGVSYNGFQQFDVGKPGLSFENQAANARTIIAEVFSAAPSRIAGEVDVVGPRANLILANQNGLSINGASFVNFGSVALTTGAVSLREQQQSSGHVQRYVDVATNQGTIDIGPQGLAGNLIRLEMIAKNIVLDGPVTNSYTSSSAHVRAVAGDSKASFDTAASPVDNLTPWVYYEAGSARRQDVAIKIGAGSKVTAGRIEILVTDQGAGVRNEGELVASAGDFKLTATGDIEQVGGKIRAQGSVSIKGSDITLRTAEGRDSIVAAGLQVGIESSKSIRNIGGEIVGGQRATDDSPYAVSLRAADVIENRTPIGATKTAVIFGQSDSVRLEAAGGISSVNARLVSNSDLILSSQGAITNESVHVAGDGSEDWNSSSLFNRRNGYRVDMGKLADPTNQGYWVAQGNVRIDAGEVSNKGGYIFSNAGSIAIQSAGGVTNQAHSVGLYEYNRRCMLFICRTTASSNESLVGGQIMAANDLSVQAKGVVLNDGGAIYAGKSMQVSGSEVVARAKPVHTVILRDKGLKALFGHTWAQIYATDQGGSFTAQQGRLVLQGAARQEGGTFAASEGVDGEIQVARRPQRDPVRIEDHLGLFWW
ncbi:MAG: filamentous hemagglutinin N-terminal domain-containing protein [Pseudomonadales bacterium]